MQLEASSERPADKGPGSSTSELWVPEHNCLSTQFLPDLTADDVQPRNQHLILNSHIGMGQNGNSGTRRKGVSWVEEFTKQGRGSVPGLAGPLAQHRWTGNLLQGVLPCPLPGEFGA